MHRTSPYHEPQPLEGWARLRAPIQPLPGQTGLFEYRPHRASDAHGAQDELFDSGRDLPGADENEQQILWDVD
jgi:hypothetical protein